MTTILEDLQAKGREASYRRDTFPDWYRAHSTCPTIPATVMRVKIRRYQTSGLAWGEAVLEVADVGPHYHVVACVRHESNRYFGQRLVDGHWRAYDNGELMYWDRWSEFEGWLAEWNLEHWNMRLEEVT